MPGSTTSGRAPLWPGDQPHGQAYARWGGSSANTPRTSTRRRLAISWLVRAALVVMLLLASATGVFYLHLTATTSSYPGAHFNHGTNAVWLEHTWAGDYHTPQEYAELAATLAHEQVKYVFVHVGPMESDGTIPLYRALFAGVLANALHADLPGVRVLAWIGQEEAASGLPAAQVVTLANPAERARIAATAASFVARGMDGVHYDIEPIMNNSLAFIQLLDATRAALPHGAILSVAAEKWAPNTHVASWAYALGKGGSWWTTYYYALVAAHVDQLVVMAYNTAMPTANLYSLLVKQETQNIITAAQTAPHPPQVLIGLPTYTQSGNSAWFHPDAETIGSGLSGVSAGLNSIGNTRAFAGVALYRFGTTTDREWTTYDHQWLGN